jgi:hypothetical protein
MSCFNLKRSGYIRGRLTSVHQLMKGNIFSDKISDIEP